MKDFDRSMRSRNTPVAAPRLLPLAACLGLVLGLGISGLNAIAGEVQGSSTVRQSTAPDVPGYVQQMRNWRAQHPERLDGGARGLASDSVLRPAAVRVVSNCNDEGPGSLRETVAGANSGDIIDLSGLACATIDLESPVYINDASLTLTGSLVSGDPRPLIEPASGNTGTGLLVHQGTGTLTLENLKLSSGTKYGPGGCVRSSGSVHLDDSQVKYCSSVLTGAFDAKGGAVYAAGDVEVRDSIVRNNSALSENGAARGGGIYAGGRVNAVYSTINGNYSRATGTGTSQAGGIWSTGFGCRYSTVSNNESGLVGGVLAEPGSNDAVDIYQCTISGNKSLGNAASAGVFIDSDSTVSVKESTISGNQNVNDNTAGLHIAAGASSVTLRNTLVAGNWGGSAFLSYDFSTGAGITVIGDHNLIGYIDGAANIPADTIDQDYAPMEPLQDNGGPTETQRPATGNWAFNLGVSSDVWDQAGNPRAVGAGVDIGAVETDALFIGRFEDPLLQ